MQLNTDTKIILATVIGTGIVLIGAVVYFSKTQAPSTLSENVVAANGLHWHPRLAVYTNGEKQEFTDGIGLGAVHQKMHTHTEDYKEGIVHMEMSGVVTKDETKLSNFFRIWGKEFNSTQIFDKKNNEEEKVKMLVNGKINSDFENYEMHDGDMIEIKYE